MAMILMRGHGSCGDPVVAFHKGETMKSAKSILYGATALALAIGSATAGDPAETISESMSMDDSMTSVSQMYEVDEDRDGRTDRLLMLEQSDSLA
jgi:hypothetical protein